MIRRLIQFLIGFCIWNTPICAEPFVDSSSKIFLPKEWGKRLAAYQNSPATWWNFLVLEKASHSIDDALEVCQLINAQRGVIGYCEHELKRAPQSLLDLVFSTALRIPMPGKNELRNSMKDTYAKLSLPLTSEIRELIRYDPFSWTETFLQDLKTKNLLNLQVNGEFLEASEQAHFIIPLEFSWPPSDVGQTDALLEQLSLSKSRQAIGPHISTHSNQKRIEDDLETVSWLGLVGILLFAGFLYWRSWHRARWIFLPVILGILCAVFATIFIFGSIHGLCLSFGSGLAALTMDYGLHRHFSREKHVWRSNFLGLLTSLVMFIVLLWSKIPLIQQIAFFSLVGVTFGFLFLYFADRRRKQISTDKPLRFSPRLRALRFPLLLSFPAALFFIGSLDLSFSLKNFDYAPDPQKRFQEWLFVQIKKPLPLFRLYAQEQAFDESKKEKDFAESKHLVVETISNYLPPPEDQAKNLQTWNSVICTETDFFKTEELSFFKPFLDRVICSVQSDLDRSSISSVRKLVGPEGVTSLWFPRTPEETALIKEKFSDAVSLRELSEEFPQILMKELTWIGPLSLVLIFLISLTYLKRIRPAFLSFVPFLTGLSFILLGGACGLSLGFVSFVGILMLLGFSVDYGIFIFSNENHSDNETLTAISLAAWTNFFGFIPLCFAKHPVLLELGWTLTLGTLGAYLAAVAWGIRPSKEAA